MGVSYTSFNEVLNGKRQMSAELAMMVEAALGLDADTFVCMQARYNMQLVRENKTFTKRLEGIQKIVAVL